jgi:hypothetical protein
VAVPKIFISYRRSNSAPYSGRIYDTLEARFGKEDVFFDHYSIRPGAKFNDAIIDAMDLSGVVLAVIAPGWAKAASETGRKPRSRRLDDPMDMVRRELRAALAKDGFELIPLLVGGARMPEADQLPDNLIPLVHRNAATLPDDPFWRPGMDTLIAAITETLTRGAKAAVPELSVAVDAIQRQDYEQARRLLSRIVKEHQTGEIYYYRGLAGYFQQDLPAAVDDWDQRLVSRLAGRLCIGNAPTRCSSWAHTIVRWRTTSARSCSNRATRAPT